MPTYSFENKPLGLNLELDFENEPTKEDIYDVIKTQVDNKQIYDLIDGDEESKAFAIDAYRSGYFKEPEDDVDILDGIVAGAKSFGRGFGEIMVDNGVARSRLSDLAKASGGLKRKFSDDPFSYMMPEKAQWDEVAYSKEIDANLQRKIDKASVRVLDDSLSMSMPWDKEDAQNTLGIAMDNEGLPMNDPELRAEVSRRANDLFKLKNRATLYQTISNYAGGYALLGSLAKREINQSDWLSSEQSDNDVIEELKHLRLQEQVMSVMENGAITGAQVVAHNNISDSNNIAEGIVRAGISFFGGDKETAKRTEDALRKGLVSPDHDQALAMEVIASPENLATPLASMATQAGVRKFTSGQLRRLYNEYIPAKQSLEKATSELHNLRNGRAGQILSPESYKGIEDALVAEVKASRKITDKLGPKITDKFNDFSKPPLLRKGLGLMAGWAGKGIDTLGRTAQALRGMPKELAIDTLMKASKTLSPQDAEKLLYTLGGVGGIAYGGIQINNENWKPDYWDAIIGAGFLLGPRALRSTGTNLRHLGNYWTKSQGSKNLAQTIQQLDKRASISDALIDRSIESGYINTLKQSGKVFQEGVSQGKNKLPLENIGSKTRNIARGATAIGADKVGDFLGRTAVTTAQGVALPGAIGYAIGGEEGMAGAIGPSLWFLGSGMVAGEFVRAKSLNDLKIKQRGDISNHVKGLSGTQADLYKRLTPENQAGVASITQKFPDLEIQLIDDPNAGNGTYRFNGGQPVAIVNVSGDAPLVGALAHEVGHHITRHGLTPMVHEIFFGSHAKGKPGVFTALDEDNNPIVEYDASGVPRYKLNDEFDNIRNVYNEKLENTPGVDEDTKMEYATNPELILDEVVAEHVAHLMLNDQGSPGILNRNVGDLAKSLFSAISGKGFIRDAGVGLGLATDEFGNGLFQITENKDLSKLIKDFENLSSRRSKGEMGDMLEEDFSSDISVSPASLKDDRGLQRMFNNTLVLDANGNPELTISGLPKFMTNAQINKRNREMSSDLSDLIEGAGDLPNGHVKMSKSADGKMMGEGLFIDDSIINKLANSGKYTASQINFLKTSSTIGRQLANNDINGNEVLMFYYPATRGGRKYKSLKGGYRSALIWGIKVSKADNVYMQTLSLTAIEKNLSRMLKTKKYSKDLYDAFDGDSQIELRKSIREKFAQYLDNHHKGRSNDDGNNGITTKQKDILNALLGENVKAQSEANPYLKGLGFTPERSIKSRRLDRIGSLEVTGKGGFVDYYKMKQNHMPNVGRENPNQLSLFSTDELLDQNPNMSKIDQIVDPTNGLNFDKKYIKNLASKILDKVSLSTDDAGMLDGIGDNYAEQHGVLPSDLVGELYKQFFARSGYRMPRLRGLRDNVDLAIEKLGQEKFTTEQLESALKKVPGGIPYVKDLGLLYPPMEKLTRTQVMRDVEKRKLNFEIEELVGDKGRYTQHTDLQTPGEYDAMDSIEFLTYFQGGGKYGKAGTIRRRRQFLIPAEKAKQVAEQYIDSASQFGSAKVKDLGKFRNTKTGKVVADQEPVSGYPKGHLEDKLDYKVLEFQDTTTDAGVENTWTDFDKFPFMFDHANDQLHGLGLGGEGVRDAGDLNVIDPKAHWQGRRNMAYWTRTTKRRNTHDERLASMKPYKQYKRVRHIEEVQSDWHKVYRDQQQGKRHDQLPQPPMESNWYALALKEQLLDAHDSGLEQVSVTQGHIQNKRCDLSDVIESIRIFDAEAEIGSGMKEGYTLQKHQDSIDRIMDLSAEVYNGDRETGLNYDNKPYRDVAKFDRVIELDLSNAGRQKFSIDADGNVLSLLEGEMTEAVGKSLADIVGKNVADQVMSTERGKILPEKLDPKVKILVEENFDVLKNMIKEDELQWEGILDLKSEDLPLPKDSNPEQLNNRYNELLSSYALDVLGKKFKDQGIDPEDGVMATERGDTFFNRDNLSKVHIGDSEVLTHYFYKFRQKKPINYHKHGILTNPTHKDFTLRLYSGLVYEHSRFANKDIGSPIKDRIAEKNKKKGYMGQIKPDKLDYEDPKLIKFYDGAIRKTMDKFAKRMGVEKSKSISFDQNDPDARHGWVIDLPKDRKTIEDLGLYMPKLGKDEVVNFAEPVPLVKRSRSLQLKESFKTSSTDKLVDDLGNAEAELGNYLQPGEPLEVIPVEGSNFAQKRNGLVERVNDLKQVLSQRAMPRLNPESKIRAPDNYYFNNWFGDSVMVDENGVPEVYYHGSKRPNIGTFKSKYPDGLMFFAKDHKFAEKWPEGSGGLREPQPRTKEVADRIRKDVEENAGRKNSKYSHLSSKEFWLDENEAIRDEWYESYRKYEKERSKPFRSPGDIMNRGDISVYPVFLRVKKLFDPRKDYKDVIEYYASKDYRKHNVTGEMGRTGGWDVKTQMKDIERYTKEGNYLILENPGVVDHLDKKGYDGMLISEQTNNPEFGTIAVWDKNNIKSAIGNNGDFSNHDSIMHMPRTKDGEEYGMRHRPADREQGNTMDDMSNIYPDDVYSPDGLRIYGDFPGSVGYHNQDMKALQAIRDARRNPDKKVKVYRAVDTIDGDEINPGDWVSTTEEYAIGHGEREYGEYKILEKEVRANDLTTEGNSIHEWGYDPEIHKFMPLLGLPKASNVKYKDNQNLIPIVFKDMSTLADKHVTFVEADRHDTDFDRMGGPLHAFLKSNDIVVSVDGATFRPQWANLKWSTLSGMINRVALTDEGHALITLMHEDAHRSNKKMLSSILDGFESNRPNMSPDEIMVVSNAIRLIKERQRKGGKITKPQADFLKALGTYKSSVTSGKNVKENFAKIIKKYGKKDWWTDANTIAISKDFRSAHADTTFNARADIAKMFMRSDKTKSKNMPFAPDVDAMLFSQMDYHGGKKDDVVGVVQLSKHKLDSPDRVFGVYLGDDPKEAKHMTNNELKVKEQLLADPNFKVHMSYDWLMLGPGDADFFMLEKPFDTNKILSTDYFNFHEKSWRDKVTKLGRDYEKKWKRPTPKVPKKNFKKYTKPSEDEQTDYKKFLAERNKTPLILQGKSNKTGTYLRKGGFVPRVMK